MQATAKVKAKYPVKRHTHETGRHTTSYLIAGPLDGPLMIFMHGHPELSIYWHRQIDYFSALGWRCVAPDMRGYGGSSVPERFEDYTVREIVTDMIELHDSLGGAPAVWIGHDWGSAICWTLATHYPERCRAIANMNVPYLPEGLILPALVALVDRRLYPREAYAAGQWDYWLFYRESFSEAARQLGADVEATISAIYQTSTDEGVDAPSWLSNVRAQGGWFGPSGRPPSMPHDADMLPEEDFEAFVAAFRETGFAGADSWYMNDEANAAFAKEASNGGRITLPTLFIHGAWDTVCKTVNTRLPDPMRAHCTDLEEGTVQGGHFFSLERPRDTNTMIDVWLKKKGLWPEEHLDAVVAF